MALYQFSKYRHISFRAVLGQPSLVYIQLLIPYQPLSYLLFHVSFKNISHEINGIICYIRSMETKTSKHWGDYPVFIYGLEGRKPDVQVLNAFPINFDTTSCVHSTKVIKEWETYNTLTQHKWSDPVHVQTRVSQPWLWWQSGDG